MTQMFAFVAVFVIVVAVELCNHLVKFLSHNSHIITHF